MINSKTSETNRDTFTQKSTNKVKLLLLLRVIHLKTYKLLRDVINVFVNIYIDYNLTEGGRSIWAPFTRGKTIGTL